MKTLYLDLGMGAAGDMLSAALLELVPDPEAMTAKLNAAGIPGVEYRRETVKKCGVAGTRMSVRVRGSEEESLDVQVRDGLSEDGAARVDAGDHDHGHAHSHDHDHDHGHAHSHDHHHTSLREIEHLVNDHLKIPEGVRRDVLEVYRLIAEAESSVHGVSVEEIHFHEVGTMDALADITAVCMLMEEIGPGEVIASPVHVGSGHVRCAHGILPVPAPATAYILKGVPIYGGKVEGELCTPTGAALVKHFVSRFGDMPVMRVEASGCGMGTKDFAFMNGLRVFLGETGEPGKNAQDPGGAAVELLCNLDDMTGEKIGFAMDRLFEAGALDVWTMPIGMKKSRPGILLGVLCREEDGEAMAAAVFKHTTTLGIRQRRVDRYVLQREIREVETPYGVIREKSASGFGVSRSKFEYEDLARAAAESGVTIEEVELAAKKNKNTGRP